MSKFHYGGSRTKGNGERRVLLLNPAKRDEFKVTRIHMGLSLLGTILTKHDHTVLVIDYAFLDSVRDLLPIPDVEEVIRDFRPDVVGISVFSYLYDESQALIERVSRCCDAPIMLGGPHTTFFPEDFANDDRVSYIVRGEAESVIVELVENARYEIHPLVITPPTPSAEMIPAVDLDIAYGSQFLEQYQIQLSRGCPYHCSFCNVQFLAGRKMRYRNLKDCVQEIVEAKRSHPGIVSIGITDDCPTLPLDRFKKFTRMLSDANLGCGLWVDNMRANLIDDELLELYKMAGGSNVGLGVESGNHEVFALTNKGQDLETVVQAAKLVRKHGLILGLCFVIGLPEDTLERHFESMELAKCMNPDYIFWNMCVPWPGTEVRRWFEEHGEIGDVRNFSTLISPRVEFTEPVCSSSEFSREDRIRAWLMANMETHVYFSHARDLLKLIPLTIKYKIYRSLAVYLFTVLPLLYIRNLKSVSWRIVAKALRPLKRTLFAVVERAFSKSRGQAGGKGEAR